VLLIEQTESCMPVSAPCYTSHMTPHRYWVHNYTPLRVAIRLADNSTVYSAGVRTVVFNPVVRGKAVMPVEFS